MDGIDLDSLPAKQTQVQPPFELNGGAELSPAPHEVLQQLGFVLQSRDFRNAARLQGLLTFLVEETLQGRGDYLNISLVAQSVFNKGVNFTNSEDSIVRVTANRLRKSLNLFNATDGKRSNVLIELETGNYTPKFSYRNTHTACPIRTEIIRAIDQNSSIMNPQTNRAAMRIVSSALAVFPEDPDFLAFRAQLLLNAYMMGFHDCPELVDDSFDHLSRIGSCAEQNVEILFSRSLHCLQNGDIDGVRKASLAIAEHSDNPEFQKIAVWMNCVTSDPLENARSMDWSELDGASDHGWMKHPQFLACYASGEYEDALATAISYGMPGVFWGPLVRAASLAQLGITRTAAAEMQKLHCLNPKFASNPKRYLTSFIPSTDAMEHVLEGLEKAGLHQVAHD